MWAGQKCDRRNVNKLTRHAARLGVLLVTTLPTPALPLEKPALQQNDMSQNCYAPSNLETLQPGRVMLAIYCHNARRVAREGARKMLAIWALARRETRRGSIGGTPLEVGRSSWLDQPPVRSIVGPILVEVNLTWIA